MPQRGVRKKAGPTPQETCKAAFSKYADGDTLPMESLHLVLRELNLPVSSADVVNVQGGLRALIPFDQNSRSRSLNIVSYDLFQRWYLLNTQVGHYRSNNALLVKRASYFCTTLLLLCQTMFMRAQLSAWYVLTDLADAL